MAMADAIRQSDVLPSMKPPISFLDLEKIKKENSLYNPKLSVSAALNMPAPSLVSPLTMYSGPPPPYSYPSSTASSVVGHGGYISPTESRKTADDDKDPPCLHRHSLPSIHEALGSEQPLSIHSLLSKPTSIQTPQPTQNPSPTAIIPRSYPEASRMPPNLLTHQSPTAYHFRESLDKQARPQFSPRTSSDSVSSRFPPVKSHENHYPTIQPSRTASSPTNPVRPTSHALQPQHSSPVYERSSRASTMNSHYSYSSYQAPFSYPSSSANIPSYPHAALQPPTWRSAGSEIDRAEEARRAASKGSPKMKYGESVKRHLEIFDLETSLNEIAEGSRIASDFARNYGVLAHQDQRNGLPIELLPSTDECEEMIRRQKGVVESLQRIQEVIQAQQIAALEQQQTQEQRFHAPSEYDEEGPGYHEKLDGGGGFAGPDAKKRRGRAAPPGRCHSCNRAETPEWRRGPDGARTLCNACGLHYAKLTRKMGSKASSNTSNLRPKEMSAGPP